MKVSGTAGDHTVVSLVGSAGLTDAGLIPGRDRDMVGIGVAGTQFKAAASGYDANQRGLVPSSSETALEATYLAELTPWMLIFGSDQYVISPSAPGSHRPQPAQRSCADARSTAGPLTAATDRPPGRDGRRAEGGWTSPMPVPTDNGTVPPGQAWSETSE